MLEFILGTATDAPVAIVGAFDDVFIFAAGTVMSALMPIAGENAAMATLEDGTATDAPVMTNGAIDDSEITLTGTATDDPVLIDGDCVAVSMIAAGIATDAPVMTVGACVAMPVLTDGVLTETPPAATAPSSPNGAEARGEKPSMSYSGLVGQMTE